MTNRIKKRNLFITLAIVGCFFVGSMQSSFAAPKSVIKTHVSHNEEDENAKLFSKRYIEKEMF